MGKPTKPVASREVSPEGTVAIHMRLPADLVDALDAWVTELRQAGTIGTGHVTRTDVIRDVLANAVAARKGRR